MAGKRKYPLNEEVFSKIDSEDSAYWLGFLSADGYITSNKIIGCKLGRKDEGHLEKLRDFYQTTIPIYRRIDYSGYCSSNGTESSAVIITSKNIYSDLCDLGLTNKKSSELRFPEISDNMIRHYIRGYFDGDGSIYQSNSNCKPFASMSIVGNEIFLKELVKHLPVSDKLIYPHKSVHSLQISGDRRCRLMYNYMYQDSKVFLERKKLRFETLLN